MSRVLYVVVVSEMARLLDIYHDISHSHVYLLIFQLPLRIQSPNLRLYDGRNLDMTDRPFDYLRNRFSTAESEMMGLLDLYGVISGAQPILFNPLTLYIAC